MALGYFLRGENSMIWIGEFKETYNDDKYPSIHDAVRDKAPEHKEKVLAYLKGGKPVAYAPGYFYDVLNDNAVIMHPACYEDPDGVYAWRSDVIHYYEKYNIELPADFVEYVLSKSK